MNKLGNQRKILMVTASVVFLGLSQAVNATENYTGETGKALKSLGSEIDRRSLKEAQKQVITPTPIAVTTPTPIPARQVVKPTPTAIIKANKATPTPTHTVSKPTPTPTPKITKPTPTPTPAPTTKPTPTTKPIQKTSPTKIYKPTPTSTKVAQSQPIEYEHYTEEAVVEYHAPAQVKSSKTTHHAAQVVEKTQQPQVVVEQVYIEPEPTTVIVLAEANQLPTTGPGLPVVLSIGGIVVGLLAWKYFCR